MQQYQLRAAALAAALLFAPPAAAQQQPQPQAPAAAVVVDSIEIVGASRVPEPSIRATLGIGLGDTIIGTDVARAVQRLYASGQFEDVQIFGVPGDAGRPLILRVEVREQPLLVDIEFEGLENLRSSTIRDTVGLRAGQPYSPARAVEAEAMTRRLLAEKGFQVRRIAHRLEAVPDRPNQRRLVFEVDEGRRVAIADVAFEGNQVFDDGQLAGVLGTRREGFLWFRTGSFDEERLREDLRVNLPAHYARNGYIDFAVLGDTLVVDPETGKGRLVIRVQEGPQYRLASFEIRGSRRFATEDLRRYFETRRSGLFGGLGLGGGERQQAGEIFDAAAFEEAAGEVRRLYSNNGYLYAQVQPLVERLPADTSGRPAVRATWDIQEGQVATVGRVTIRGNTFTHENIIRSQLFLLPGDVYSEERLLQSYRRISGLGFFETPVPLPDMVPDPETGEVDITFEVKERQTGSVNFGTALGGYGGLSGFLGYDQPNLFGRAKTGHLRWEFGRYSNNIEASYSDPAIADSWVSGSLSLFSSRDRFFSFREGRRRRTGAGLRFGVPVPGDRLTRFSTGYSLSRTTYEEFENASSIFSLPPGVQSTVSLGLTRNNLDHPLFPTAGTNQEIEASLTGGIFGGDGEFQKYTINGQWYVPVGSLGGGQPGTRPIRFTLGLSMEGGALFGDATRFPFDRFYMGGVQFGRPLRGYDETTITPAGYYPRCTFGTAGCDLTLAERFGNAYLRLSAEYAIRFNDNISLGAFYDAGNVWRSPSEINPTRLLRGAGLGLMLVTPFGPLGLDYAYGFDKDVPGWQLHFKFGQGF
ncbi:MAG TPA: outer membrane protein assembly factor BamA [Longimicrobiales bacterium]|nr:outer membrane protein assembly factor BamA [Longimicrobiales bacterium]